MAGPGITAGSAARLRIDDDYLHTNRNDQSVVIDVWKRTPAAAFSAGTTAPRTGQGRFDTRGISVDGDEGQGAGTPDWTAAYGFIRGQENDDPEAMQQKFNSGIVHPCRFRYIYPYGTTARGINIHQ